MHPNFMGTEAPVPGTLTDLTLSLFIWRFLSNLYDEYLFRCVFAITVFLENIWSHVLPNLKNFGNLRKSEKTKVHVGISFCGFFALCTVFYFGIICSNIFKISNATHKVMDT